MSQISGSGDPRVQISPNFGCRPYGPCRIDCAGQPAASSKKKLSDFHKITSYGSVQVSGAQISNFFEIGSLEPENGTKTCPKMAYFVPRAKILNFGPIKLCLMANMGFSGPGNSFLVFKILFENVFYRYRVYLGCILGVF